VVLASAPVVSAPAAKIIEADYRPDEAPQPSLPANALMHQAGLRQVTRPEPVQATEPAPKATTTVAPKATKPATKAAANFAKTAPGDPHAPLPGANPSAKAPKPIPVASATSHAPLKDSGQAQ
jgi:hypothetical protein